MSKLPFMGRPRTVDVDFMQSFQCSYILRAAIVKSAALDKRASVSAYIRASLEQTTQKTLGPKLWHRLKDASMPSIRSTLFEKYVSEIDASRVRRSIDRTRGLTAVQRNSEVLSQEIKSYLDEFTALKIAPQTDIALCVILEEAVDIVHKIGVMLSRKTLSVRTVRSLQRLTARLPDQLRADMDAAILSKLTSMQAAAPK